MRVICVAAAVLLAILSISVSASPGHARDSGPGVSYQYYKEIPGVTADEIALIERMKQTRASFTYGVTKTTESFIAEDNTVDGFSRLVSERLSGLFGIPFIPRPYGWDALNVALQKNEIDFTGELSPTPERMQQYFMTDPMIQRTVKMFTDREGEKLSEIAKSRPLRAAFLSGSVTYAQVEETWRLPYEAIFLDSELEAVPLLRDGKIDVYLDESSVEAMFEDYDFIRSDDYYPLLYSPLSLTTNNPELRAFVSVMQKYLQNGGFYELTDLYREGLDRYLTYRVLRSLTDEEKDYIRRHDTPETAVSFAVESDNYPSAFYNAKEKAFQGISVDTLKEVTQLTGLQFRVVTTQSSTWPEMLADLEDGKVSIVSELLRSEGREGKFLWLDTPYSADTYALLSRVDYPDLDMNQILRAKVGLITDSAYADLFREWFPANTNTRDYVDINEAFAALESGEIDLLMGTRNLLLSLTNYLEKPGFKANIVFDYPYEAEFGLGKNEVVLQSILNKALRHVNMQEISDRWQRKVFDYNSKMLKDTLPFLILFVALLATGFVAVMVLLLKNRKMSRNLENIVAQRTAELEHASRAKTDFLSRMSHEMRTPMNAIIGMCKIAANTNDIARLRYCLATIDTSSGYLLGLINDILEMSKIEAGKLELNMAPLNLEKTLVKVCNLIVDKTEEKAQTLSVSLGRNLHRLYMSDELRLSQVVMNLLSNAVKFTPNGGSISLAVEEMRREGEKSVLRFSVSDTGIGMTQAQIGRLFKAFEQADGSIATRFGGTGLGLAISKSIVEKMDGRVRVESQPDEGSTFSFEVALERLPQTDEERDRLLSPMHSAVLFIGAAAPEREHFCSIAEELGLHCDMAADGEEGIRLARRAYETATPYDVVFIDVSLPDNALGATVRELGGLVDAGHVVFFASFTQWNAIGRTAAELGVDRFLSRPLFPSNVADVVNAVMTGPDTRPSMQEAEETADFSHIKLLLVEDVAVNREIFIALLEETGLQIDSAENGLEALQMFKADPERYDLIVMDLQMPLMDGYTATREIRSLTLPRAQTIPIIAMTANAFKEDVDKCLEAGMNDHMSKPIDEKEVRDKIRRAVPKKA